MKTKYLYIGQNPNALDQVIDLLIRGEVVAFPTETVYGLGICYDSNNATSGFQKICKIKNRNASKPVAICLEKIEHIKNITQEIPAEFWMLGKLFLPGPLTIVFSTKKGTLGIRVPEHKLFQQLLKKTGPLCVTSANYSNKIDLINSIEVYQTFKGSISAVVTDGIDLKYKIPSTVIQIMKCGNIQLLREGPIPWNLIQAKMQHNYNYQT